MAKIDELVVELVAESSKLRSDLKSATAATEQASADMQKAMKEFSQNSSKDVSFFESTMSTMAGMLGSSAIQGAFSKVVDLGKYLAGSIIEGAKAAAESEKELVKLANALTLTGKYSQSAMAQLEGYIDAQSKLTGVSGEAITSSLSLLSTMTKLNSDGLEKASRAAMDLSAAYSIDLQAATRLVAKGIEGNTEAFGKLGINVDKGANKSENLNNILKSLTSTQGAAAGAAKTFNGTVNSLTEAYNDFYKIVGVAITQNPVVVAAMNEVVLVLREINDAAGESGNSLKQNIAEALVSVLEVVKVAVDGLDFFVKGLKQFYYLVQTVVFGVIETINGMWEAITMSGDGSDPFAATKGSWEDLQESFSSDTALSKVSETIQRVTNAASGAMSQLSETSSVATKATVAQSESLNALTEAETARIELLKTFAQTYMDNSLAAQASMDFQLEMLNLYLEEGLITQTEFFETKNTLLQAQYETEQALLDEALKKKAITEQQYADASNKLIQKNTLASNAFQKSKVDFEKNSEKERQANLMSSLNTIATMSDSSNKTLAALGKASAVSIATIDGIVAVQKALASAPPPFNIALAAMVGAATAANVAKISGVKLKNGIDEVPGIGNEDNFSAVLAPGERVVPKSTNKDLKEFLERENAGGNSKSVTININISNNMPASREAGAAMIEAINDAINGGSIKILGMA